MNSNEKPYQVYVGRSWTDYAPKNDPEQCQVSVWSHDRSMSSHQCNNKGKEVVDLYFDDVPRLTCGQHIAAVERRAKKEREHEQRRDNYKTRIEEDEARVEAIKGGLGISDGYLITEYRRDSLLSYSTGRVSISIEDLERIINA